jgi:hypothetical protein
MAGGSVLSAWALLDGATPAALILLSAVVVLMVRSLWERGTSTAAILEAVRATVQQGMELSPSSRSMKVVRGGGDSPELLPDPVVQTSLRATG